MKVDSAGQVTIPKSLCEKYGLRPDTEVEFVETGRGTIEIRRTPPTDEEFRQYLDRVRGCADGGMTTDEVMQMTRGED